MSLAVFILNNKNNKVSVADGVIKNLNWKLPVSVTHRNYDIIKATPKTGWRNS